MKTQRYCLVIVAAIGLCWPPVLAQALEEPHEHRPLLARPNPTLEGIADLYVTILPPDANSSAGGLVWAELDEKVQQTLKQGGVKVQPVTPFPRPELRVYVDMLKMPDARQCVVRVQVALARDVVLPSLRNLTVRPDVWKTGPAMQALPMDDMPDKVNEIVLDQIQTFALAYRLANPKDAGPTDANAVAVPVSREKPAGPAAKHQYVGSKNSKVFHRAGCGWAERIAAGNLTGYDSRAQAIKAGKRPCKQCKP